MTVDPRVGGRRAFGSHGIVDVLHLDGPSAHDRCARRLFFHPGARIGHPTRSTAQVVIAAARLVIGVVLKQILNFSGNSMSIRLASYHAETSFNSTLERLG